MIKSLTLSILPELFAICRLKVNENIPTWALQKAQLISITRTMDELSIVCPEQYVPNGIISEKKWKVFKIEGPLDFSLTGILVAIAQPLANANISIFSLSTYDTDYIMVKEENIKHAVEILQSIHNIKR